MSDLSLDETKKLKEEWEKYVVQNSFDADQKKLTASYIFNEFLTSIIVAYKKAKGNKKYEKGMCCCGAAFQLTPELNKKALRIVYTYARNFAHDNDHEDDWGKNIKYCDFNHFMVRDSE